VKIDGLAILGEDRRVVRGNVLHVNDRDAFLVGKLDQTLGVFQGFHAVRDRHAAGEVFILEVDDQQSGGFRVKTVGRLCPQHRANGRLRVRGCFSGDSVRAEAHHHTEANERGLEYGR
jgi:hypothetical protein